VDEVDLRYKLLLLVALTISYAADLLLIAVWQNLPLAYLISLVVGFCFGLVVQKAEDFVVLWIFSYIFASFVMMLIFVLPGLYPYIVWVKVEIGILATAGMLVYNSIFIVPLSICAGLVGLYLSDKYFKRLKVPFFVESGAV